MIETINKFTHTYRRLTQELTREPLMEELATELDMDIRKSSDDGTPIVAIEAGRGETLRRFVGRRGLVIGMESFGASAPYADLASHFGFTAGSVATRIKAHV